MKTAVVYDSFYGNTQKIAEEIGKAVGEGAIVFNVEAFNKEDIKKFDLLFIGSPTRIFRPTRAIVRLTKYISKYKGNLKIAYFDTRMSITENEPPFLKKMVKRFGYATDTMTKIFSKKNVIGIQKPNWFYVGDTEGPLLDDEIKKAIEWTKEIVEAK